MSWLPVALAAYLILAIVNLLDKFLVDNVIKNSRAYAFAACTLGLAIVGLAPWFLVWPGWGLLAHNIFNGFLFAGAIWSLYAALKREEASRVLVFVGGLTPVFSLILSLLFFEERFSQSELMGMASILVGVLLIAFLPVSRSYLARVFMKFGVKQNKGAGGMLIALVSAIVYALYFVSTKDAYSVQPFMSAFIWTRVGAALGVAIFLLRAKDRRAILSLFTKATPRGNKIMILCNQALGATGFILQNYAVFLGSVVIVNSLQGVQYAFLLIISTSLALWAPRLLKENFSWKILLQKSLAVVSIILGLYFIAR